MFKNCPVCAERVIMPSGPEDSKILVIASSPTKEESEFHRQWSGNFGTLWRKYVLKFCEVDPLEWRRCFLWYHEPTKNDDCLEVSLDIFSEEIKNKNLIILMGAEAVAYFMGMKVADVSGMDVSSEDIIKIRFPDTKVFVVPNPNGAMVRSVGELEFALTKLKEILELL